jgi:hypothetical protein
MISNSNYETHKDEVELLNNILFESIKILEELPNFILEIIIVPDIIEDPKLNFKLKFTLPDDYPNSSPIFEVTDVSNYLASSKIKYLHEKVKSLVEENLGMTMMYQIYEMVKDFANEQEDMMHQETQNKIKLEEEKVRKYNEKVSHIDKELMETRTFTPVTKESFDIWFKKFYAEGSKERAKKVEQDARQSGREHFMNSKNLTGDDGETDENDEVDVDKLNINKENIDDKEPVVFDENVFDENIDDIDFDEGEYEDDDAELFN